MCITKEIENGVCSVLKLPLATLISHMGTGSSPTALLAIQVLANASDKAVKDDPKACAPAPVWEI